MPVTRKYTAMIVPQGLNRPGLIVVPPRNAAAKAGKRKLAPSVGLAAPLMPTAVTPATPVISPEATNEPSEGVAR